MKKINKGFTLIELLVVISIISVLAAISLFGLQNARETGRDAARKGDLQAIATALEIFRSDCHEYPTNMEFNVTVGDPLEKNCDLIGTDEIYLQEMPGDPVSEDRYFYSRGAAGVTYTLCSHLEDPPDPANETSGCGACNPSPCGFRVLNP